MQKITIINGKTALKKEILLKRIKEYSTKYNLIIQIFDSKMIVSKEHLLSAVFHALRSFERKENLTKTIENEMILYASGERQIKNAIEKLGVKNENVIIVVVGRCDKKKLCEFLKIRGEKLKAKKEPLIKFGFSSEETNCEKPQELILEKIAMLVISK